MLPKHEGTFITEDKNGNDLDNPYILLEDGRQIIEMTGVDWKANPDEAYEAAVRIALTLKPSQEIVHIDLGDDSYWIGTVKKIKEKTIQLSDKHAEMVLALLREERQLTTDTCSHEQSYDVADIDCAIGKFVEAGVEYSPLGGWDPE